MIQLSPKQLQDFNLLKAGGHSTLKALLEVLEPAPFSYALQLQPDREAIEADYIEFANRGFFVIFDHKSWQIHIIDDKTFDNTEETEDTRDLMKILAKLRVNFRLKKKK